MNKIRQRYIIFEIFTKDDVILQEQAIIRKIWKKLLKIFGENRSFKAGLWIIAWDPINLKGILRFDHMIKSEIITTLALIKSIDATPVIFHCRKTTGTIKKGRKIWEEAFNLPIPRNSNKK